MGALLLALVATMTPFFVERDIAYAQITSNDANLADSGGLAITGQPGDVAAKITPKYDTDVTEYTARIPYSATGVTVTAVERDTGNATITYSHPDADTGTAGRQIDLSARGGMKTDIRVTVTAEDGTTRKVYTITVYRERQSKSDNANLSSLGLQGVTLSPSFSASETTYNARVRAGEVTVSYGLSDTAGGASAAITSTDGGTIADMKVTLNAAASEGKGTGGVTNVTVTVTAEDGSTKPYAITVYRIRDNASTNANLETLTLAVVPASPAIEDDIDLSGNDFNARVANGTTHVTVASTKADAGAMITGTTPSDSDGAMEGHQVSLSPGATTTIMVNVKAEDERVTKAYTVKVYRERQTPSTNANLSSLSVSPGTLSGFNPNTQGYDVRVGHDDDEVTVAYTMSDAAGGASAAITLAVSGGTAATADGMKVTLGDVGETTTITVTVTAEDGSTTKAYNIRVYRVRALASADATLNALSLDTGLLVPAFTGATTTARMFNVIVENATRSVTVTATASGAGDGAARVITPADADTSSADTHQVALTAGMKNRITVVVTAEDGVTTETYTIDVYRKNETASTVNTLSSLSLSDGMLDFMSDDVDYDVRVGNSVDEVTVMGTPTDNAGGAMVSVGTSTDSCAKVTVDADNNKVPLPAGAKTTICVQVTPEAGNTPHTNVKTYMITVYRMRSNPSTNADLSSFMLKDASDAPDGTKFGSVDSFVSATSAIDLKTETDPDVGYRIRKVTIETMTDDVGAMASIMPADADPGTPGHQIDLMAGVDTMITVTVTPEDPTADAKTYMANVYRMNIPGSESDDATLSSLTLSNASLTPAFMSDTMDYTATVPVATPASNTKTKVSAMATHIGAQSGIQVFEGADKAAATAATDVVAMGEVTLGAIGTTKVIRVTVTAEDGTAMKSYFVAVTVGEASAESALLARYGGSDGVIDLSEVSTAIDDFFDGNLTEAEISIVIDLFFGN